ncbi:MAG: O-antigen ligase family protein, partial [Promethearchaeota archaeon]
MGLFKYIFDKKGGHDLSKLVNVFTIFIFIYFLLVLLQASLASMFYSQSIIDGLIRTRNQLYYGSFFLFLLLFDKRENADRFMSFMTILSISLICLALINYFGPIIFHHSMAEGWGERSGIKRAVFPGISIVLAVGLWHFVKYLIDNRTSIWSFLFFLLAYAAVVFRQTRGQIIALSMTIIIVLFTQKKLKLIAGLGVTFIIFSGILSVTMEENILLNPFSLAYEDIKENKGTVMGRMEQVKADWELIKKHPFVGSGGLVIRVREDKKVSNEMRHATYGADL